MERRRKTSLEKELVKRQEASRVVFVHRSCRKKLKRSRPMETSGEAGAELIKRVVGRKVVTFRGKCLTKSSF